MQDWKKVLKSIYTPDIWSLLAVPNKEWNNGFASNKDEGGLHPALVEKVSTCDTIFYIIPGTSKDYQQGSCVFKIKLNQKSAISKISHFLIKLSMPCHREAVISFSRGWDGVDYLSEKQIEEFKMQLKFCRG